MITGFAALATAIILAALLHISSSARLTSGDAKDTFRPKASLLWVMLLGIPFYVFAATVIYLTWVPPPTGIALYLFIVVCAAVILGLVFAYWYYKAFHIKLYGDHLETLTLFGTHSVKFSEICKFDLVDGGRGGQELKLFDSAGTILFTSSSSVNNFDELVISIRRRLHNQPVVFRHRDSLGNWTESSNGMRT